MKYMLLMQFPLASWRTDLITNWPAEDIDRHLQYLARMRADLEQAGELVATHGLNGPEAAVEVRANATGSPVVSDGPFAEFKEFLAGYMIVDVETAQRAYAIAARWSHGPGPGGKPGNWPVEVREVLGAGHCDTA
jgi:hypothetical protein